jgi:peroxiredoxin
VAQSGDAAHISQRRRPVLADLDRDVAKFQGNESWMLPIPATFVVGRSGRISARYVDPDYRKRTVIDDLVAALRGAT